MSLLSPFWILQMPLTRLLKAGQEYQENIAVGFPCLVSSGEICYYASSEEECWMGWILRLTSYGCSQGFKQPLGCRLVCRGHSSALQLKQNLHHVQLEMEGRKGQCKEGAWYVLQELSCSARIGKLGSLHLHHHLLFFHLDGAVPTFRIQRGCRTNNIFLGTQVGAALGKWWNQNFRSLENLGEAFQS